MHRLIENPYWLIFGATLLILANVLYLLDETRHKINERAYINATYAAVFATRGSQFEVDSLTGIANSCISWKVEHRRLIEELEELP